MEQTSTFLLNKNDNEYMYFMDPLYLNSPAIISDIYNPLSEDVDLLAPSSNSVDELNKKFNLKLIL